MTKREFEEEVRNFDDLISFCRENDYFDISDEYYDEDGVNSCVNEELYDYVRDRDWTEVRDALYDIPTGRGWYKSFGYLEFEEVDEDAEFESLYDDLLQRLIDDEFFDEDEEQEEEEAEDDDDTIVVDMSMLSAIC